MDASMGGRAGPSPPCRVGPSPPGRVGPSPPPLEKKTNVFFPYRGPSYSCGDLFANFFATFLHVHGGGAFWDCPPPYKNFCWRHAVV